jgi:diadenosine tetraphosphate (Ap4A) HIT family hydrolase
MNCPFCDPEIIRKQIFGETKQFRFFYNHKPVLPGHSLIVPKRHIESILDMNESELAELGPLMKKLSIALMKAYSCDGIDMSLQNGATAGASVAHIHWHLVPRKAGDIQGDPSLWMAKVVEAERSRQGISDEDLRKNIERIKKAL